MTTQPPPSAADLLEQCAEALRKLSFLAHSHPHLWSDEYSQVLAAYDSHIADARAASSQSAEVARDVPVAWLVMHGGKAIEAELGLPETNVRNGQAAIGITYEPLYAAPPSAPVRMEEARTARGGLLK